MNNIMYWRWEKSIPKEICDMLLSEVKQQEFKVARLNNDAIDGSIDPKIRISETLFLPINHWFEGILMNHAMYANSGAGWNVKLTHPEEVQITRYKAGGFYDWHSDADVHRATEGNQRKLSVVCQLNDSSEFTGGGLELKHQDGGPILVNQGDVVAFLAPTQHRALEVTSGTRYSAVCWVWGPKYV